MRTLTTVLLLIFAGLVSAQPLNKSLEEFNSSPAWENSSGETSDNPSLTRPFQGKNFICRDEETFTPTEKAAASDTFSKFVEYVSRADQIENFFIDPAHRKKREDLLETAIKSGSWKAKYFDSVWSYRHTKAGDSKKQAFARLVELGGQGIPIAAYKIGTYFGRQDDGMYYWLDAAIDRGSVDAMTAVGSTIVVQSKALRPIGKLMLECAVSKNHANAYKSLGILADMEGRRLDAYRLWIKGVNEGCEPCLMHVESIARTLNSSSSDLTVSKASNNPSLRPIEEDLMSRNTTPELELIKRFYGNNWSYEISELPDFARRLPKQMEFRPSDATLLLTLELERRQRAEQKKHSY
ncbi:hypothetical protein [Pseudomonas sp. Pseusp3]|uniref:hypothetical protein n=1 Tax=unclassified Pseudomonas TaxID=196821 RepID=UPI0039B10967